MNFPEFDSKRIAFRQFLAELDLGQIKEIVFDAQEMYEYKYNKAKTFLEEKEFNNQMKREFPDAVA